MGDRLKDKQKHITWQQMQDYEQGKLSADEMHKVESHLHQCELCQEAMEGMEKTNLFQAKQDMLDLKSQLQQRLSEEKYSSKKLYPYWKWAAAIIIFAVLIIALLESSYFEKEPAITAKTENKIISVEPENKATTETDTIEQIFKSRKSETYEENRKPGIAAAERKKPDPRVTESLPVSKSTGNETRANIQEIVPSDTFNPGAASFTIDRADKRGINTTATEQFPNPAIEIPSESLTPANEKKNDRSGMYTLIGKVVSVDDGEPLPGVTILQKNSNNTATTDVEGNFSLMLPSDDKELTFSSIGYITEEIPINGQDSILVRLSEDIQQLNEVVVVGYGQQTSQDNTSTFQPAQPSTGNREFKQYIQENLQYPQEARQNNIEGTVVLSFQVSTQGKIQNVEVKKSLGYGCDQEAIRLLKEGPEWKPAEKDGQTVVQSKKIRIRFKLS